MFNKKERVTMILVSIIFALTLSLIESLEIFAYTFLLILIVIFINVLTKKITAFYFDSEIEISLWEIKRMGLLRAISKNEKSPPSKEFKNPFPIGAIMPLITTAFSFGYITWLASLIFDAKPKIYRPAKRSGFYAYSEIPEFHLGWIAASGILANLASTFIGYLIGIPEFVVFNLSYAFFNLIPISELDGNKILFASKALWSSMVIIFFIVLAIFMFIL